MLRWLAFALLFLAAAATPAAAKDLSADSLAIVHDLIAPYRGGVAQSAGADPSAVTQALAILKKENLLDAPRPTTRALDIGQRLGRALALGTRTTKFLTDVSAVYDAIVHQNDGAAKAAIQQLYSKLGRKPPEGVALDGLIRAVKNVVGRETQETERVSIERADYTIVLEHARAAGKAKISVFSRNGPGGKPARVDFKGDLGTRPDDKTKDLRVVARGDSTASSA